MDKLFKAQVFEIVNLIPKGRVTSYGAIAKAVGLPNHSRHVGKSLRDYDQTFPAHRVCNSLGFITASCSANFAELLETEGILVEGNKIKNFRSVFWNPLEEL